MPVVLKIESIILAPAAVSAAFFLAAMAAALMAGCFFLVASVMMGVVASFGLEQDMICLQ